MLNAIADIPALNQYLKPEQIGLAKRLTTEAQAIVQLKDENHAQSMLDQMDAALNSFPVPTVDKFWALMITTNKNVVTPVEKSEVQQIVTQMETAANRGDIATADQHLDHLRKRTSEIIEKYPSNLLRSK